MRKRQTFGLALCPALLLLGSFGAGTCQADFVYSVSVNTSSIGGTSGYVDMQFDPVGSSPQLAYASVTNFQSDGTLGAALSPNGDASGTLPGPLSLDNGTADNEITQSFTFGTTLSFDVTLSGPAVDTPNFNGYGSSFLLYLYDGSDDTLLTTDTNYGGAVAVINLNSDGTTSVAYVSPEGSVTPQASAVPEPSSLVLLLTALPAGLLVWRRRRGSGY